MTNQAASLKAKLQGKRSELAHSIRAHSAQLSIAEGEHDVLDQIQSMSRRDEVVAYINMLTRTLTAVNAALVAIEERAYGTCVECDGPISPKRLEVIPWASRCVRCQEAFDRHLSGRSPLPQLGRNGVSALAWLDEG